MLLFVTMFLVKLILFEKKNLLCCSDSISFKLVRFPLDILLIEFNIFLNENNNLSQFKLKINFIFILIKFFHLQIMNLFINKT